jgi:hypothetical protein
MVRAAGLCATHARQLREMGLELVGSLLQLAPGDPATAMSAASGGHTVNPLPRRTSDAQRDLFDERLT